MATTLLNAVAAAGAGAPIRLDQGAEVASQHTAQVVVAGTPPTALDVALEGSLNGTTWHPLAAVTAVAGGLVTVNALVTRVRANVRTLTLATGATDTTVSVLLESAA